MTTQVAAVWTAAQARLRDRLGAARTADWLFEVALLKIDRVRARAVIEAPSPEKATRARQHQTAIEAELAVAAGMPRLAVRITSVRGRPSEKRAPRPAAVAAPKLLREAPVASPAPLRADLALAAPEEPESVAEVPGVRLDTFVADPRLTLASFIVGPTNELAHRFAREVAERPAGYVNPFLVHGETGTGKSHLLHGIANGYVHAHPGRKVVFASSERFATQFSLAVRGGQAARFRELYRETDLLVLDDVQQLAGKPETERELLHTIDELVRRRRQVVLASTLGPKRLPRIDQGLEGRLVQGVVVELKGLDEGTRERLVSARAAAQRLDLDDTTVRALARRLTRADQILGALKRLDAHARLLDHPLTPAEIQGALGDVLEGREQAPSPEAIAEFVARAYDLEPAAIQGTSRKPAVVEARQLAMALARRLTTLTLREIGAHFGNRSCACVHFAHGKVKELRDTDPRTRSIFEEALARFAPARTAKSAR